MDHTKKQTFTASALLTLLFFTLANGYRFFHTLYSGDSLYMLYQNNAGWEVALGRFLKPVLTLLRGALAAPFLISVLSLVWLCLSVYFVVDFLEIKRTMSIALIAAVMSCNITVLSLSASFFPDMDFYLLALFLSIFGVWLMKKGKPTYLIAGSLSLCASLAIYQSYICVSIALVMIHFLYQAPAFPSFRKLLEKAAGYLFSFMAAAAVYFAAWKILQYLFDIWTADSYNGLASIGDYSQTGIGSILAVTCQNVLDHFVYPQTFITNTFHGVSLNLFWTCLLRFCNAAVLLMILFALVKVNIKIGTKLWQKLIQLIILVLFPLGINFVCVVSRGMEHTLMIYAFHFVYILAVKLAENLFLRPADQPQAKSARIPWLITLSAVTVISWSNIVFSNQVYLRRNLQENAAQSLMTRIVYSIEAKEDYIPGVTPVAFSGTFENSPCISDTEPFDTLYLYGMGKTILTYPGTDHAFLSYVLNANMNLAYVSSEDEAVQQMPVYPAEGSIAYIDGMLVVKISE
ncbi:MAG: glucosyltransferase domain-containing protein [Lachnospiraceae bacterium]|nr:glucosyltransferase domain-containing protein [Lachnospiraceae bacterium]MCM1240153.1 glucosyltransferase domain-containing protein [Lachnospiraceae bacterium]